LEEIRQRSGINSAELARRAGMENSTLWRIESGYRGRGISANTRARLARALMVREDQLFAPIGSPIVFADESAESAELRPYAPEHSMHAIGERLQLLMLDTGLTTPERLAQAIGAAEPDVIDWLAGNSLPPHRAMARLMRRCGVTMGWLYFGDEAGLLPGVAARLRRLPRGLP
jgi:transcriptional regulator with XRE-family HTH domain